MSERVFGTDGIRGRAGEGWLAPAALARIGAALGSVLRETHSHARAVLVGNDGRSSADAIRDALATGLAASGQTLLDPIKQNVDIGANAEVAHA
jgi:phosphoglucosamine mutase